MPRPQPYLPHLSTAAPRRDQLQVTLGQLLDSAAWRGRRQGFAAGAALTIGLWLLWLLPDDLLRLAASLTDFAR